MTHRKFREFLRVLENSLIRYRAILGERVLVSEIRFHTHSRLVPMLQRCVFTDHVPHLANKILCLKNRRASLYDVKVIKMSRLAIPPLLILDGLLCCCETKRQTTQVFCPPTHSR